jgi:trans-aconitate 2-methyltransferase
MPSWDPETYERFKAERDRPALDLLLRIPVDLNPVEIWDLGCGTGEHAAVLAARHPGARVHGLDSSADMLARARARETPVDWVRADLADFEPKVAPDLVFSNAALQWASDHQTLLPRLASRLAAGGVFACQMPTAHNCGWHLALRDLAAEAPWTDRLSRVAGVRPVAAPEQYYDWLSPLCGEVDIWSTTYLHALEGDDPVVDWMRGTTLRPYLDVLTDAAEHTAFLAAYRDRVRAVLPARSDGATLFPFPRLFILARR